MRITTGGTLIHNVGAWEQGRADAIKRNAAIRRSREWLAADPNNARLSDWLNQRGEFKHHPADADKPHPLVRGMYKGDFGNMLCQMQLALDEWGSLSEKQTAVVAKALARAEQRLIDFAAKKDLDRANSQHVGNVGERREFALKVEAVFSFETRFGITFVNVCRDGDNNVVVYKGSNPWERGDELRVKATIKEDGERDGIAQTLISRPTIL